MTTWKNYQPPVRSESAALTAAAAQLLSLSHSSQLPTSPTSAAALSPGSIPFPLSVVTNNLAAAGHTVKPACRETGVIEKKLTSYGFVQCSERDCRLFFHFSEYNGDPNKMQVGDTVEFQQSYDKRTGKPVAISIMKISEPVQVEVLSEQRFAGVVMRAPVERKGGSFSNDDMGRVSYEHSGEHFFLPFDFEDIEGSQKVLAGDKVTFQLSTDRRTSVTRARALRVNQPRVQGVVCSMKENYGFIERADVVKEIFFHFTEFKDEISELKLGDDVEFTVQSRTSGRDKAKQENSTQPREVAVQISKLPAGTVVFEDVAARWIRGRIQKPFRIATTRLSNEPLAGRIEYETPDGCEEIPFGDKDQLGDFTLLPDDIVQFNIATDRRDQLKRARNITFVETTFTISRELRETGFLAALKDGYGFIKCADRDARMFFHFSELMDHTATLSLQDELQFTVIQDPATQGRSVAIRIVMLPKGTICTDVISSEKYTGVVQNEPASFKSPNKAKDQTELQGEIAYEAGDQKLSIAYMQKDVDSKNAPKYGDTVQFQILSQRGNKQLAVNVQVKQHASLPREKGFVATMKDNYGFIESQDHTYEVFFHFSAFGEAISEAEIGDEVEFTVARKSNKLSAENIKRLPKGSVSPENIASGTIEGKIVRPMRIVDPEQDEYEGLVQVGVDDSSGDHVTYPYGITSLVDKKDFLQRGDVVKFQVAVTRSTGQKRATGLRALRSTLQATVDSVRGQFGFLDYEVEAGRKLFFHMSEVNEESELKPGDLVQFVVVQNQRNQRYSACSLQKVGAPRPERLLSRLKSQSDDGPRVTLVRQPLAPDSTPGFSRPRVQRVPGALPDN